MSQRSATNPRNTKGDKGNVARKSAASAKPARTAGGSVRTAPGGSNASGLTKEQRRDARSRERAEEDQIREVSQILLDANPVYVKRRRLWWVLVGFGLVMVIASAGIAYLFNGGTVSEPNGIAGTVALVLAYLGILGGLFYDFIRIRPLRRETDARAKSMTAKKRLEVIKKDADARAAKKAARKASKKDKTEN